MSKLLYSFGLIGLTMFLFLNCVHGGVPIPGLESGPTPFQWLFATGFSGAYNTFGSGTTAGAIGNYG
ncbi:Transcription elongation factor spt5, partial [Orchesella cincta]